MKFLYPLLSAHSWTGRALLAFYITVMAFPATAQFRVEVSGVGLTQLPIAIATFRGEETSPQKISAIISADLERSGQFRGVETGSAALDELARPDFSGYWQTADMTCDSGCGTSCGASIMVAKAGRYPPVIYGWSHIDLQILFMKS